MLLRSELSGADGIESVRRITASCNMAHDSGEWRAPTQVLWAQFLSSLDSLTSGKHFYAAAERCDTSPMSGTYVTAFGL